MKEEKNKKNIIKWFLFAVAVIVVYKLLDNFADVQIFFENLMGILTPFLVGILIAYLFYFPCKSIEKIYEKSKSKLIHKKRRMLAVTTVYLIALLVLVIVFNVVLPAVSKSLVEFASNLPTYYKNITEFVSNQPEESILKQVGAEEIIKNLEQIDVKQYFSIENIIQYIQSAIGFVNGIFTSFVAIIVSVYILLERNEIMSFFRKIVEATFTPKVCKEVEKYVGKTNEVFYKFISSQIIDGIVVGTILSIAMLIMNVKYAILLGFMIGLFNIIPYFGAIIAVVISLLITLLTGGLTQTIWTAVVIIILQQIDANIINPRIVGDSLKLSPLLVIFAVTVGGAYFGVLGMFLAVPAITVIKILVDDLLEFMKNKKEKSFFKTE